MQKSGQAGQPAKKNKNNKVVARVPGQPRRSFSGQGSWAAASDYLRTILAPHIVRGVKVPDANTAPSFTCTGTMRNQSGGAATGPNTNISCACLVRVGYTELFATTGQYDFFIGLGNNVLNNLGWTGADKSYAPAMAQVASLRRPVSCGLYASFQGNTISDQGRFIVAFIPPGYSGVMPPVDINADVLTLPYVKTFPLKANYAQTVFLPVDEIARMYQDVGASSAAPIRAGGEYGWLLIVADGMAANQVLEFTIVENFEALPLTNQLSIAQPTVSHSDPIEMAVASNAISNNPSAGVAQPKLKPQEAQAMIPSATAGVTPTKSSGSPSFLDRILSGAGTVAKALPSVLAAAAPLLAAL